MTVFFRISLCIYLIAGLVLPTFASQDGLKSCVISSSTSPELDSLTKSQKLANLLSSEIEKLENQEQLIARTLYDLMNQQNYHSLVTTCLCVVSLDSSAKLENIEYYNTMNRAFETDFRKLFTESLKNLDLEENEDWKSAFAQHRLVFEIKIRWSYAGGSLDERQNIEEIEVLKTHFQSQKACFLMQAILKEN